MSGTSLVDGVTRILLATPASAGLARDLARAALVRWELPHLVEDAVLVVDELAANALAPSKWNQIIKVHAGLHGPEVILGVWDGGKGLPVNRMVEVTLETLDLGPDDSGGRGIAIVEALARRWWVEETPPGGKWVCAAFAR